MTLRKALKYALEDFFDALLYSSLTGSSKPMKEYFSSLRRKFFEIRTDYWKDKDVYKTRADDF